MNDLSNFLYTPDKDDLLSMYKLLLSSEFGCWLWEPDSESLFFNEPYMRMLGYEPKQFPYHLSTWKNLIHPEDREETVKSQLAIINSPDLGNSFESRFRMRSARGEYLWILGRGFVVCRDEQGKAFRVAGMHIDMRTLDQTLEEIATEHDRMWFALEAARDGLWDWNAATGKVYYSPRYISMMGYKPHEFPATVESWSSRVHPEDLENTVQMQYKFIESPKFGDLFECVYRFLAADGSYKWILGRGKVTRRDAQGRATRLVGLHTDITELRTTQEALTNLLHQDSLTRLHSRFFFDSTINSLQDEDYPLGLLFCDVDGLKLVNDHMGHATGDELLATAASIIRKNLPSDSVAARLGGDEFAVLLRRHSRLDAEKIMRCIQAENDAHNATPGAMPIYISIGVVSTDRTMPPHRLLSMADKAMIEHKNKQRGTSQKKLKLWIENKTGQAVNLIDPRIYSCHTALEFTRQ